MSIQFSENLQCHSGLLCLPGAPGVPSQSLPLVRDAYFFPGPVWHLWLWDERCGLGGGSTLLVSICADVALKGAGPFPGSAASCKGVNTFLGWFYCFKWPRVPVRF